MQLRLWMHIFSVSPIDLRTVWLRASYIWRAFGSSVEAERGDPNTWERSICMLANLSAPVSLRNMNWLFVHGNTRGARGRLHSLYLANFI